MKSLQNSALVMLVAAVALSAQTLKVEALNNPAGPNSSQVNWSVTQDGNPIMSWVESDTLKYAIRKGGNWSEARTIAAKRHFFHHPAELPEVIAMPNGAFMAHWIETPKPDSEAEFPWVSASRDGIKWTTPAPGQRDKSEVEHGLASMVSNGDGTASLFFLQSQMEPTQPTSLKRSIIGADGAEVREEVLDADVCECCPTASAKTARGLIVVYRDHTKEDIRDMSVTRFENGHWTSPKIIFPDKWQVDACPVNAGTVSAKGDRVAVSWYTAGGNNPRVELSLSPDSGADFTKAAVVSTGSAYGYTSIAIDDAGGAYVSWLERNGDGAKVLVRHVSADGKAGPVTQIATGTRKSIGYPRIIRTNGELLIGWNTDQKVMTAKLGM